MLRLLSRSIKYDVADHMSWACISCVIHFEKVTAAK